MSLHRLGICLVSALCLLASGCGLFGSDEKPPPLIQTRVIKFYLDRQFNQGMVLPVDIVFIDQKSTSKQVLAIGSAPWFEEHKRDTWPAKQSHSFQPGGAKIVKVTLDYRDEDQIQAAVIMANYAHLDSNQGQSVVIPPESKPEEIIFVTGKGIYR